MPGHKFLQASRWSPDSTTSSRRRSVGSRQGRYCSCLRQARRSRLYVIDTERRIVERNRPHLILFVQAAPGNLDPSTPAASPASETSQLSTSPQQSCPTAHSSGGSHDSSASRRLCPTDILASISASVSPFFTRKCDPF